MTRHLTTIAWLGMSIAFTSACAPARSECGAPPSHHGDGGPLRPANSSTFTAWRPAGYGPSTAKPRRATMGRPCASPPAQGIGLIWIEGTDFADGTIEVDVCGRDVGRQSFVGVAFHRKDEQTFEAV